MGRRDPPAGCGFGRFPGQAEGLAFVPAGNSLMAPGGPLAEGRDLTLYRQGPGEQRWLSREQELAAVRQAEQEALMAAL